jgi:signal transduction histidine kinase
MTDAPGDAKWPRLLALTVHEFRTPISVVSGYIRMVLKDPAGTLDERYRRMLQEAEKSCGRLTALAAEMSDLSHLEDQTAPFKPAQVDLQALLAQAIAAVPDSAGRSIAVELTTSTAPITIEGDATRLVRAFTAILWGLGREAVGGDRLVVRERGGTYQGRPASWIAIAEPAEIDRLASVPVESLTTFDEWRGGCGLSLAIARRTIDGHGGALWSPAEGTKAGAVLVLPR